MSIKLALLSLAVAATASAGPGGCTDVPLRFTLHQTATLMNLDGSVVTDSSANPVTAPSAIVGDGNDVYTNGSGVGATIKYCSNTYDAVLNLIVSKRKITAILPIPIAGSGATYQTPPAGTYTDNGAINVRNIICKGCLSPGQPFVTRGGVELDSMYNGTTYHVKSLPLANVSSLPFAPDLDNDSSLVSTANSPNPTSLVMVLPQPYNCGNGVYPSWIVRGTLQNQASGSTSPSYLQVATLGAGSANTAAGQFSMPFEYQIQALSCFNPGY